MEAVPDDAETVDTLAIATDRTRLIARLAETLEAAPIDAEREIDDAVLAVAATLEVTDMLAERLRVISALAAMLEDSPADAERSRVTVREEIRDDVAPMFVLRLCPVAAAAVSDEAETIEVLLRRLILRDVETPDVPDTAMPRSMVDPPLAVAFVEELAAMDALLSCRVVTIAETNRLDVAAMLVAALCDVPLDWYSCQKISIDMMSPQTKQQYATQTVGRICDRALLTDRNSISRNKIAWEPLNRLG